MGRAFENMEKCCSCCDRERRIVNSFFKMCQECNTARLKEDNKKEDKEPLFSKTLPKNRIIMTWTGRPESKSLFAKPKNNATKQKIDTDEKFYEQCFNNSDHLCEECGTQLPDIFRSEDGKVVARYRYSHIIPKSIAPELRHNENNINHLCLTCHERWENRDKENMNIFAGNVLRFPKYFSML